VESNYVKGIVSGFYVYDGENKIVLETNNNGIITFYEKYITDHTTTLEEETTIEINGKKYNKEEVESRLSELKEIK